MNWMLTAKPKHEFILSTRIKPTFAISIHVRKRTTHVLRSSKAQLLWVLKNRRMTNPTLDRIISSNETGKNSKLSTVERSESNESKVPFKESSTWLFASSNSRHAHSRKAEHEKGWQSEQRLCKRFLASPLLKVKSDFVQSNRSVSLQLLRDLPP